MSATEGRAVMNDKTRAPERAAFEKWYLSKYRNDMLGSPHCTESWFAWEASRQAAAPAAGDAWISVEDRLPEEGTPVLVWVPAWSSQEVAHLNRDFDPHPWRWCDEYLTPDTAPTHWQPLPAAPSAALTGQPT